MAPIINHPVQYSLRYICGSLTNVCRLQQQPKCSLICVVRSDILFSLNLHQSPGLYWQAPKFQTFGGKLSWSYRKHNARNVEQMEPSCASVCSRSWWTFERYLVQNITAIYKLQNKAQFTLVRWVIVQIYKSITLNEIYLLSIIICCKQLYILYAFLTMKNAIHCVYIANNLYKGNSRLSVLNISMNNLIFHILLLLLFDWKA